MEAAGPLQVPEGRRAASLLALLGAAELTLLAPALVVCVLAIRPGPSLDRAMRERLTPEQLAWSQRTAPLAAGVIALLGVAPAAAFIALGPVVRRGAGWPVVVVRCLLLAQLIELLVLAAQWLPGAAGSASAGPSGLTVLVLAIGTPVLTVAYTFWRLGRLPRSGSGGLTHG